MDEYLCRVLVVMCILFVEKSFIVAGFTDISQSSHSEVCINIERTKQGALLDVMDVELVASRGRCLVVSS